MRPRRSCARSRARAAAKNPRTLKLPVGWRHSSFKSAPSIEINGVRITCGLARSAAARIRSTPIIAVIEIDNRRDADLRVPVRGMRQAFHIAAAELLVARSAMPSLREAGPPPPGLDLRHGQLGRERRRRRFR